jgi:hypothetical protein
MLAMGTRSINGRHVVNQWAKVLASIVPSMGKGEILKTSRVPSSMSN